QRLGPQGQCGGRAQVGLGLRRGAGRCQFQVLDAKLVEQVGDRDLLLWREVSRRELLALTKCRLDDLERSYAHGTSEKQKAFVHRDERPSLVVPPDFTDLLRGRPLRV